MEKIEYRQKGLDNEYGKDHILTNKWNPIADYGNEYSNVYFRIEAAGYQYPSFSFTKEAEEEFYTEVKAALSPLGWISDNELDIWNCDYIYNGKSRLYLHPQSFSGEVLKNDIKAIAEALQKHNTFRLRWVDLYETVYDISDSEYEGYLNSKDEEIRRVLFEKCGTTRTNKFYYVFDVCQSFAERFRLKRIGQNDGQTIEHIGKVIDCMITAGLLICIEKNGNKLVRTPNKTEQKKLKINVV